MSENSPKFKVAAIKEEDKKSSILNFSQKKVDNKIEENTIINFIKSDNIEELFKYYGNHEELLNNIYGIFLRNPYIFKTKDELKALDKYFSDDIQYIKFYGLLDEYQKIFSFKNYIQEESILSILMDYGVPFYNKEKLEDVFFMAFNNINPSSFLYELQGYLSFNDGFDEGFYDFSQEEIVQFLKQIEPIHKYNFLMQFFEGDEHSLEFISEEVILKEEELFDIVNNLIKKEDNNIYQYLFSIFNQRNSNSESILDFLNRYHSIDYFLKYFKNKNTSKIEDKNFTSNFSTFLLYCKNIEFKNINIVFSPEGDLIFVSEKDIKQEGKQDKSNMSQIIHMISQASTHEENLFISGVQEIITIISNFDFLEREVEKDYLKDEKDKFYSFINIDEIRSIENISYGWSYEDFKNHVLLNQTYRFFNKGVGEYFNGLLNKIYNEHKKKLIETNCFYSDEFLSSNFLNNSKTDKNILLENIDFHSIDVIKSFLNIDLKNTNISIYLSMLSYLNKTKNGDGFRGLKKFFEKTKNKEVNIFRFKVFLSLDQLGEEFGEKILELGELENADEIFEIYVNLIDKIENIREELQNIFKDKQIELKDEHINKIVKNILKRGANILLDFSNLIEKEKDNQESLLIELQSKLKEYDAGLIFELDTLKTLSKDDSIEIKPEDIEGLEFSIRKSKDIFGKDIDKHTVKEVLFNILNTELKDKVSIKKSFSEFKENALKKYIEEGLLKEEDIEFIYNIYQMMLMYKQNYQDKENEDFVKSLLEDFIDLVTNPERKDSRIYEYKKKDESGKCKELTFLAFSDSGEDEVYFGKFNALQGFGIGQTLLNRAIEVEGKGKKIVANTIPNSPAEKMYLEKYGFKITGQEEYLGKILNTIELDLRDIKKDNITEMPVVEIKEELKQASGY